MPYKPPKIHCDPPKYHLMKDIGNYVVYGDGRVWSKIQDKFLKPSLHTEGYLVVSIGKGNRMLVHRLIAQTFIPNPENLPQVSHENNDKKDNRVENLKWCTNSYNTKKGYEDGLNPGVSLKGEANGACKLTEAEARRIKYDYPHLGARKIAPIFNIGVTAVKSIRNGKTWSHI